MVDGVEKHPGIEIPRKGLDLRWSGERLGRVAGCLRRCSNSRSVNLVKVMAIGRKLEWMGSLYSRAGEYLVASC